MNIETRNAIIERVSISTERCLSAWLHLTYGHSGQGFGGYALYSPWAKDQDAARRGNYTGVFINRCIEIGGVENWEQLPGKTIRVRCEHSKVHAIGHIVKDDWFNPSEEFGAMQKMLASPRIERTALAFCWTGEIEDFPEWVSALNDPLCRSIDALAPGRFLETNAELHVRTAEGPCPARIGDWLLKQPDGTLTVLGGRKR